MNYKNFLLDKFQEDAIHAIESNHSVVVSAPTGSGKTLIADYIVNKYIDKNVKVVYTAPIKALSNQKYKEFSKEYGERNVGLMTGDIVINSQAPIIIMTTEIYRNMVLVRDPLADQVTYVIFDEIHYINDIERGYVWEESIIFSKEHVRFLCLSATIPNADEFAQWIHTIKRHPVDVVHNDVRYVPLHKQFFDAELGITTLDEIKELANVADYNYVRGKQHQRKPKVQAPSHIELVKEVKEKLPGFFFCFSRKKCQDNALELYKMNMFPHNAQIVSIMREKFNQAPPEINQLKSTQVMRQTLPYGIGFHHAGLLPIIKELVEDLFSKGLIKVLYTTETFAVGINMPAKTVCFESLRKFDGIAFRYLNSKEYFQIAGRAGRRGIDTEGFAIAMIDRRDFDYKLIRKITDKDVDPIKSQFRLSINTVLNLLKRHTPEEIDEILCMNFASYQKYGKSIGNIKDVIYNTFDIIKKRLFKYNFITEQGLTDKGEFASRIYADELLTAELFATTLHESLDEHQILILVACLSYEPKERTEYYKTYPSKKIADIRKELRRSEYLSKNRKLRYMEEITALVEPMVRGKTVFEVLLNTNLLEGDVIRFFRQMLDRIGQIRNATMDHRLIEKLRNCQDRINECIKDVDGL